MKFNKFRIGLAAVATALALSTLSIDATVINFNGNTITNANAAYWSGTNSAGVVTNNYQTGTVPGASNVLYTLSKTLADQPGKGTNGYLPAFVFPALGGFPGSLGAPTRVVTIEMGGSLVATNASSTAIVFKFARTGSGVNWFTNYQSYTLTIPVNSTQSTNACIMYDLDTYGSAYIALQEIDNPGVAALTNIVINITGKSGL